MAMLVAVSTALVIWIVLWALGMKAIDASFVSLTIVVLVATARIVTRYLPGRDSA